MISRRDRIDFKFSNFGEQTIFPTNDIEGGRNPKGRREDSRGSTLLRRKLREEGVGALYTVKMPAGEMDSPQLSGGAEMIATVSQRSTTAGGRTRCPTTREGGGGDNVLVEDSSSSSRTPNSGIGLKMTGPRIRSDPAPIGPGPERYDVSYRPTEREVAQNEILSMRYKKGETPPQPGGSICRGFKRGRSMPRSEEIDDGIIMVGDRGDMGQSVPRLDCGLSPN